MSQFAVIVTLRANAAQNVMSGALGWLCAGEWGSEIAEFDRCSWKECDRKHIPKNVTKFKTREEAEAYGESTKREPEHGGFGCWWQKPTGKYEVVEIKQKFKQVPDGYEAT